MDPERYRGFSSPELTPKDNLAVLPPAPPHKYGKGKRGLNSKHHLALISAAVIVLLIAAGLGLLYFNHHTKTKSPPAKTGSSKQIKSTSPSTTPTIASTSYTSVNFNTTFNYPSSWTITDSGSAPLNVTSPPLQLKAANNANVLGQVVLTLANKGSLPAAYGTQSIAVLNSQKITYSQPSTTQAAASYISFVQYPTTVTAGGMDAIFLSGNYGYLKDQSIPASDLATVDPLVYVSFYSCASSQCPLTSRQALSVASTDWSEGSFSAPIMLMFNSFTFE